MLGSQVFVDRMAYPVCRVPTASLGEAYLANEDRTGCLDHAASQVFLGKTADPESREEKGTQAIRDWTEYRAPMVTLVRKAAQGKPATMGPTATVLLAVRYLKKRSTSTEHSDI